jgi:hypothetical protein
MKKEKRRSEEHRKKQQRKRERQRGVEWIEQEGEVRRRVGSKGGSGEGS